MGLNCVGFRSNYANSENYVFSTDALTSKSALPLLAFHFSLPSFHLSALVNRLCPIFIQKKKKKNPRKS